MKRKFFPSLILLCGMALLAAACAAAPAGKGSGVPSVPDESKQPMATSFPTLAPTAIPALPEQRLLSLEWPARLRVGDGDRVRLTLEVDEHGNITPTAEVAGHQTQGEIIQVPNLYQTHTVLAEARMDLAGVQVSPQETVSEVMQPGQKVTFYWSIRATETGTFQGTVWLHLRFISKEGGAEERLALSAQHLTIQSVNLWGLNGLWARILGGLGTLVGSFLSLPDIISWIWKRLHVRGSFA